jgi:hypothetical protein
VKLFTVSFECGLHCGTCDVPEILVVLRIEENKEKIKVGFVFRLDLAQCLKYLFLALGVGTAESQLEQLKEVAQVIRVDFGCNLVQPLFC